MTARIGHRSRCNFNATYRYYQFDFASSPTNTMPLFNVVVGPPPTSVTSAPTNVSASPGYNQATLNWTEAAGAGSYNIYRGTAPGAEGATPVAAEVPINSYTDTSASNGTTYYYKVTAVNWVGESAQSAEVSVTPSGPTAPTNLSTSYLYVPELIWNEQGGVCEYNIYSAATPGGEGSTPIESGIVAGINMINPLAPDYCSISPSGTGPCYVYYQLTAVAGTTESPKSNEAWYYIPGVPATGFDLIPNPPEISCAPGGKAVVPIGVIGASNFSGPVSFSISGAPAGVEAWCYGPSVTVNPRTNYGEGSDLWFVASPLAAAGTYYVTLTGVSGAGASYAFTNSCTVVLTIT